MGRKNRRQAAPVMSRIPLAFSNPEGTWVIELTNGSGVTTVTLDGTKDNAWQWAEKAGAEGGIKPGTWYPTDIHSADDVFFQGSPDKFVVIG